MDVQSIVISILTSLITGGFILVLVEIGNRRNRENDRYEQKMSPFMHKLSAFFRFLSWSSRNIGYQNDINSCERTFRASISSIATYGDKIIVSGGDYEIDYFNAKELYQINNKINNIWYWYDNIQFNRLHWTSNSHTNEFIKKELREINILYCDLLFDIDLIAKVSGEFYTDIYQPIEYETFRHEMYMKIYNKQTWIVGVFVLCVLFLLCLMLFVRPQIWFMRLSTLMVVIMLLVSLLMLATNIKKQIRWWSRLKTYIRKILDIKSKTMIKQFIINIGVTFSFILSKIVYVGLLFSIWAILSIDVAIIPRIPCNLSSVTIDGLNKLCSTLAYSYITGFIMYCFVVKLPIVIKKRRLAPFLKSKISHIGDLILKMSCEFRSDSTIQINEIDKIMSSINVDKWKETCILPEHSMRRNVTEAFFYDFSVLIKEINNLICSYNLYLSKTQLLLLEELRSVQTDMQIDKEIGEKNGYIFSDFFYEKVLVPNYQKMLEIYNKLIK